MMDGRSCLCVSTGWILCKEPFADLVEAFFSGCKASSRPTLSDGIRKRDVPCIPPNLLGEWSCSLKRSHACLYKKRSVHPSYQALSKRLRPERSTDLHRFPAIGTSFMIEKHSTLDNEKEADHDRSK